MLKNLFLGLLALIFVAGIVFVGMRLLTPEDNWICKNGEWIKHGNPSSPMPAGSCVEGEKIAPSKTQGEASLPNPASKNCLDKGGKLVILKETAGELGICRFSDGSECEEWQFFRGQCKKGQQTKADTFHAYQGTITKEGGKYSFKDLSGRVYTLETAVNASSELKERLIAESSGKQTVTIIASENPALSKKLILKGFQEK